MVAGSGVTVESVSGQRVVTVRSLTARTVEYFEQNAENVAVGELAVAMLDALAANMGRYSDAEGAYTSRITL